VVAAVVVDAWVEVDLRSVTNAKDSVTLRGSVLVANRTSAIVAVSWVTSPEIANSPIPVNAARRALPWNAIAVTRLATWRAIALIDLYMRTCESTSF